MKKKSVLFLGKKNDAHTLRALEHLELLFSDITSCLGVWGQKLPEEASYWSGDIIISYLSRWVVPQYLLEKAKDMAINFHPATPDYPGIGCINFALYECATVYGATCHHMNKQVDTGDIIRVERFPVYPSDSVGTLLERTYDHQLCLFYNIVGSIYSGKPLPKSEEVWARKPFSRKEFNELSVITQDMDADEIKKRIRATLYGEYKPSIMVAGYDFELKSPIRN
ncbi:MAG: hypothetical protein FJ333_09070 [Sphingomonadales bacterium]|nr:hypothetical protein [Sphingomonadales bacterium]